MLNTRVCDFSNHIRVTQYIFFLKNEIHHIHDFQKLIRNFGLLVAKNFQNNVPYLQNNVLFIVNVTFSLPENSQLANARFQAAGAIRDAALREWVFLEIDDKRGLIRYAVA